MSQIDEPLRQQMQHRQASKASAIDTAARQRLAVRVIAVPAMLAAVAAAVQAYDSVYGTGNLWNVFVSAGITVWWTTIVLYLRDWGSR